MNDENQFGRPQEGPASGSEAAADQSDAMKGQEPIPAQKPSQAEGDRDTVDAALREHGGGREQ